MKNKYWIFIFKFILFLAFIELFLLVQGKGFLFFQDLENKSELKDKKTYRILSLGDSNTALGGDKGYVAQIGHILNERSDNLSFEMINKALPAASSSIILDEVEDWLVEYKPDMVTVMMGANDRMDLILQEEASFWDKAVKPVQKLGIYRLFSFVLLKLSGSDQSKPIDLNSDFKADLDEFKRTHKKDVRLLYHAMDLNDQERWEESIPIFKSLLHSGISNKGFLQRARMELGDSYHALDRIHELIDIWSDLLTADSYDVYATDRIQWSCRDHEDEEEIITMLHQLLLKDSQNRAFIGLLGMCYAQFGNNEMADLYLTKYRMLNADGDNKKTRQSYFELAELLNQYGIKGVFIAYPARSADALKRTFDLIKDKSNIIVVDNEELFREAWDPNKYSEYFTDRNYEDIGHCTSKGNRMLAENIAEEILNKW